ncbi:geopeptide radical SAM maturase [Geomonas sp.]|uniref:geopeptide radical SAM maturase n=1 Tax=Geomonas sp. TaxID=2651584 RepID=UPI002B49D3A5|nr:geopeptide radical SAM maturase [Geomonas sp.]HJV36019.1 geopeptide radical SAM maturase [Geomonas sp.]
MKLSPYLKIYPCPEQPGKSLLFSIRRSSVIVVPDQLLEAARNGALAGSNAEALARLGFLVDDPDAERLEMRDIFVNANRGRRLFNALVVLNLDCNLACSYCYEDNFRGSFYMREETADLLVETVLRDQVGKADRIHLTFYGGEPLLSTDHIRDIARRLGSAAQDKGTTFSFSMITNGTLLTRSLVQELMPLGLIGAKFTLDGPRDTHDACRPFASGSGSYDVIIQNLAEVCDLIAIHLGGNFTRENFRFFPALLDDLLARGIAPQKLDKVTFTPVLKKAGEKGLGDFQGECLCSQDAWVIEASQHLREETLKRGFTATKLKMSGCAVEYESDLIVNYDGSLYKCPGFMSDDRLKIGTLSDGIADYRQTHNLDLWKNEECLDCPYLPICFGGCRYMTLTRTGELQEIDCRKGFYDATLETMIKQDLAARSAKKA